MGAALATLPANDAAGPAVMPTVATGAPGFSHFVFEEVGGEIMMSLVEGPAAYQVRCQEVALPCSYEEIVALAESDAPIPDELRMTEEEVDLLAAELRQANAAADRYRDPDTACGEGGHRATDQTPNMGVHVYLPEVGDGEFDPDEPDIILYAAPDDAEPVSGAEKGQCRAGRWDGVPLELVGFSYALPMSTVGADHPDGFTGPLDNWHVHYNLCTGPRFAEGGTLPPSDCAAADGNFKSEHGWMIHAWVDPDHDNQLGVFSMWNPTIWPVTGTSDDFSPRPNLPTGIDPDNYVSIENFEFGELVVSPGEPVVFANADGVPHTVTAGSAAAVGDGFDSGVFGPGETTDLTFDAPGEYPYFCELHPQMTGTITVE